MLAEVAAPAQAALASLRKKEAAYASASTPSLVAARRDNQNALALLTQLMEPAAAPPAGL